ncbi:unnamed protein product [Eruca vesicaria subsp. sativa]|uniref:Uncharacterized protein n=1 Tax=Eruca vesicaria subsp. sativa TaxID=29727 RepID=A0ABC8LUH1_ERUVS|nr:unnamed protein product [Eruca vesicaria subsp. sativa]
MINFKHNFSDHIWEFEETPEFSFGVHDKQGEADGLSEDDRVSGNNEASKTDEDAPKNDEEYGSDEEFQTPKGTANTSSGGRNGKKRLSDRGMEKKKQKVLCTSAKHAPFNENATVDVAEVDPSASKPSLIKPSPSNPSTTKPSHTKSSPSKPAPGKPSTIKTMSTKPSPSKTTSNTTSMKPSPRRSNRLFELSDSPVPSDGSPQSSLYWFNEEPWDRFTEWSMNPTTLRIGPTAFNMTVAARVIGPEKWLGNEGRNRQYVEIVMIPRIVKAVAPPENKKYLLLEKYYIVEVPR